MATLRAVFYARVSTEEEKQLNALAKQVQENKDVIASKGWELVDQYIDEGKSGTTTKRRNEYQRLLADMDEDKFDVIVIKSQDRLMRDLTEWGNFRKKLAKTQKRLYLYLDNAFYSSDSDYIPSNIKAMMSEWYSIELSKKMNNSKKRRVEAVLRGERVNAMGNGQVYGYRIKDKRWVIEPEEAEIVRKMYELYLELHSVRKVRDAMNELGYRNKKGKLFTDEVIGRVIKNEMHKGWIVTNRYHRNFETKEIDMLPEEEWAIDKKDHEPIVSEEIWDAVNNEIQSHRNKGNSKARGKRMGVDALSGKLFCSCCGRSLWKHTSKNSSGSYAQWRCSGKIGRGDMACEDPAQITGVQLRKYLLEMADSLLDYSTIEYSKTLLKKRTIGWLEDLRKQLSVPNDNDKIKAEIAKLGAKKDKLIDLYTDDLITKEDFMEKSKELEAKISSKKALLVPVDNNPDIKAIDDTIANIDEEINKLFADEAMVEEKKIQFIEEHIKKIIVLSNRDVFILLDSIAGAFLFFNEEKAIINVIPEEVFEQGVINDGDSKSAFDRESVYFTIQTLKGNKISVAVTV